MKLYGLNSDTLLFVHFVTSVKGLAINLSYAFNFLSVFRKRLSLLYYAHPTLISLILQYSAQNFSTKTLLKIVIYFLHYL